MPAEPVRTSGTPGPDRPTPAVHNTCSSGARLGISHTNAMRAIERLVTAGALAEVGGRRRSVLWQSTQVLTALDGFAARAGRRGLGQP